MIFDRFHATYLIGYTLPNEESLNRIVVYLSPLINDEIPVSIEPSILSTTLQGNFTQDSTLQIIESTSTTTTMDSRSAGSITVDTTGSISFGSNVLISTVSIETSTLSTILQDAITNISQDSIILSTIFVIQPEQTNTTSLATEPSSLPLNNSQVNYENVLVYVGIASIVLVMSLLACIMTLTTGILLYRRGRRKLEIETRNHRPTIVHPTLAITNHSYNENAPEPNPMVLVRPRSAIRSRSPSIQEEHYANIMNENLYECLSLRPLRARGQGSNSSLDGELTDKETLSSREVHPHDVELTNSELDLAKTLGSIDSSSVVESQL